MAATEKDWNDRLHDFALIATPRLFEWLGWVAVMAALTYVWEKQKSFALVPLILLGYISMIVYFGALFRRVKLPIPFVKSQSLRRLLSDIAALLLAFATNLLVQQAIAAVAHSQPL
jgi:hypothetical protein